MNIIQLYTDFLFWRLGQEDGLLQIGGSIMGEERSPEVGLQEFPEKAGNLTQDKWNP